MKLELQERGCVVHEITKFCQEMF